MKHWFTGRSSISEIGMALFATPPGRAMYGFEYREVDLAHGLVRGIGVGVGRPVGTLRAGVQELAQRSSGREGREVAETSAPWVAIVRRSFIGTDRKPLAAELEVVIGRIAPGPRDVEEDILAGDHLGLFAHGARTDTSARLKPGLARAHDRVDLRGPRPRAALFTRRRRTVWESVQVRISPGRARPFSAITWWQIHAGQRRRTASRLLPDELPGKHTRIATPTEGAGTA